MLKELHERINVLFKLAKFTAKSRGCDGAYNNDRLCAHLETENGASSTSSSSSAPPPSIDSSFLCMSHRNGLIETSTSTAIGGNLQGDLYCHTSLLRMNGVFARHRVLVVDATVVVLVCCTASPSALSPKQHLICTYLHSSPKIFVLVSSMSPASWIPKAHIAVGAAADPFGRDQDR